VPFEKSKNLVQDDKLTIECKVLGHPKPYISWSKSEKVIEVWLLFLCQILVSDVTRLGKKQWWCCPLVLRKMFSDKTAYYYFLACLSLWHIDGVTAIFLDTIVGVQMKLCRYQGKI
jgi:hypothetical protein